MLLDLKTRSDLLALYRPEYIAYEEAKCFFKLGDIVRLPNGIIDQVIGICTGGYALTETRTHELRSSDQAELLWRSVDAVS